MKTLINNNIKCITFSKNEKKNITEKQKLLLNNITKSRSQGIAQHELGEMFKMDSKTISYHLKKLDQLGIM